jgi:hypothetical protein
MFPGKQLKHCVTKRETVQAENSTTGNFFSRLSQALAFAGRKPAELDQAGVALSTYYRWRDGSVPHDRTAHSVATYLGVNADWLLRGRGDMTPNPAPRAGLGGGDAGPPLLRDAAPQAMRHDDMRALLEDIVGWAEASAIRQHLQDIVRRMDEGDLSLAGAFSVLIDTIRLVRPGLLTIRTPVSYLDQPEKKTEPEPEP